MKNIFTNFFGLFKKKSVKTDSNIFCREELERHYTQFQKGVIDETTLYFGETIRKFKEYGDPKD